jgi:hypothetical protein
MAGFVRVIEFEHDRAEEEGEAACAGGKHSADNPYCMKTQHSLWLAWDTGWHVAALEHSKSYDDQQLEETK